MLFSRQNLETEYGTHFLILSLEKTPVEVLQESKKVFETLQSAHKYLCIRLISQAPHFQ